LNKECPLMDNAEDELGPRSYKSFTLRREKGGEPIEAAIF